MQACLSIRSVEVHWTPTTLFRYLFDPLGHPLQANDFLKAALVSRQDHLLGGAAQVSLEARSVIRMAWEHPLHGPDALVLYFVLREAHGARSARGEDFAVCADAITGKILPWSAYRIREATRTLLKVGLLRRVKRGGRGPGDTSKYLLCSPGEFRGRNST